MNKPTLFHNGADYFIHDGLENEFNSIDNYVLHNKRNENERKVFLFTKQKTNKNSQRG